jgi:hypothetical protein
MTDITLEQIYRAIVEIKLVTDSVDARLKILNGIVRQHDVDLGILKDWRSSQANAAIHAVGDIKLELARMGAFGGGLGFVLAAVVAVLKAAGWM